MMRSVGRVRNHNSIMIDTVNHSNDCKVAGSKLLFIKILGRIIHMRQSALCQ